MNITKPACVALVVITVSIVLATARLSAPQDGRPEETKSVKLPQPKLKGTMSLEEAIKKRRCVRSYKDKALTLEQLSQLLWSADGITGESNYQRAAPSAGGLHPLDFYVVAGSGSVKGLKEGVWHYEPKKHEISLIKAGDWRGELEKASLGQKQVGTAELVIVVTVEYERTTRKYGNRGNRYALMDAGFACENTFLQVQSLGLAACVVGAFHDDKVRNVLNLPEKHEPLILLTIGYSAE